MCVIFIMCIVIVGALVHDLIVVSIIGILFLLYSIPPLIYYSQSLYFRFYSILYLTVKCNVFPKFLIFNFFL